MKKLLVIECLIFLICTSSDAQFKYVFLKTLIGTSTFHSLELQSKEHLESIILLPNEPFDEIEAKNIILRIDSLPSSLLKEVVTHHIRMILFSGSLTDVPLMEFLEGNTPRGYVNAATKWEDVSGAGKGNYVFVKIGASQTGNGHGSINLELHELAHAIDRVVFDKIRERSDFQQIWLLESVLMFGNNQYYTGYPEEYFAECFAYFYASEESNQFLLEHAPLTYQYIKNLK